MKGHKIQSQETSRPILFEGDAADSSSGYAAIGFRTKSNSGRTLEYEGRDARPAVEEHHP
jgi:hypothetical protein